MNNNKFKICLFTGAGFLKPFGLPTMKEFLADIYNHVHSLQNEFSDIFDLILRSKFYGFSNNAPNSFGTEEVKILLQNEDLESILEFINLQERELDSFIYLISYVNYDMGTKRFFSQNFPLYTNSSSRKSLVDAKGRDAFKKKITKLKGTIKKYIANRCWSFNEIKIKTLLVPFFDSLFRSIEPCTWVFTTNYDLIIENYCRLTETELICGFKHSTKHPEGIWSPQEFLTNTDEKTIKLVKIHGSCDLYEIKGNICRIPAQVSEFSAADVNPESLLIYPAEKGDVFSKTPFKELFRLFRDVLLNDVDGCIIIGYSFRDEIIRDVFSNALDRKKIFMLIIHPNASRIVEEFFSKHKSRIVPINIKFEETELAEIKRESYLFFNKLRLKQ
jgi:hypothetical protein